MAGAPVIEGSLKTTIHALAFGLIISTLAVNFGKFFFPNFFPYMMGIVVFIEAVLFSLDRPKEKYDVFQPAGLKGKHTIEGAGSPQIMVSAPGEDPETSPRKRDRVRDILKGKKDQKGRRESGVPPGSPSKLSPRQSLSVTPISGTETASDVDEKAKEKSEKEKKKEEEKGKKKEKEEEKERQKAEKKEEKEKAKEGEEDKSEKGTWRKRLAKKQTSEP